MKNTSTLAAGLAAAIIALCTAAVAADAESALRSALPDIFKRSEAHYKALLKAMETQKGDMNPKRFENGKLVVIPPKDWCSGFFPGSLWYLYEYTKDDFWKKAAVDYTERLIEPLRHDASNHDVGFRTYCSAGNALRLTGDKRYADFLHDTAAALRTRYDDKIGLIRSWNSGKAGGHFGAQYIVIIDNMMNLELLEWDAKNGGSPKSDAISRSQADITDRHHFRPDGSAYHILDYNVDTRKIRGIFAGQGACVEGTWSRGQAWAIYGFTMAYRFTRDERFLQTAVRAADFFLGHLPEDGIPFWDFDAGVELEDQPKDASAAAIVASALLELQDYLPGPEGKKYLEAAIRLITILSSDAYRAGDRCSAFLLHATGHKPRGSEVDASLSYADYYYLESLYRLRRIVGRETVIP